MAPFNIRPVQRPDVPALLSLIREIAEYEKLSHQVVATEDILCQSLFEQPPAAEAVLAWDGSEPAGYAVFFHNFSTFLGTRGMYLEDLYVRQHYRGQGIGRALLLHVAQLAKQRRCGRFEWTVLDWNEPAINFYKKLGADILPEWRICRVTGDALNHLASQTVRAK